VGDEDDGDVLRHEVADHREQPLDLSLGQRGRGLVHDHHARVDGQRLGDLDALLRGDGLNGLIAGVRLMTGLVENFWDDLFPRPDEDGMETLQTVIIIAVAAVVAVASDAAKDGVPLKVEKRLDARWEVTLGAMMGRSDSMELPMVGLQNSGKTTLVNVIASGQYTEDMIPTVGFNMKKVTKGHVTIKLWDIGGQPRFRSMWERYCRGVNAIVYVVDAADHEKFESAKKELHDLLSKPPLANIPLLVLGNKNDLPEASGVEDLIERLELKKISGREVCCYSISAKNSVNIDITLDWLIKHSRSTR